MLNQMEKQAALTGFESALLFETPVEIYTRVFRALKPRTPPPEVTVEFRRYANADCRIRLADGRLLVRLADVFEGAPAPVIEALAHILLGKLYKRPVPAIYNHRYRLFLNRREMRRQLHLVRQIRGRKYLSGPIGRHYNLTSIFEELNVRFFDGLLGQPRLSWSRGASRTLLGHFDPSHNAIIISRIFDDPKIASLAIEFVMFHEMLHLRFPVDHDRARRRIHTREFREAERAFPRLNEAKQLIKKL
jgi:hypothetical protein